MRQSQEWGTDSRGFAVTVARCLLLLQQAQTCSSGARPPLEVPGLAVPNSLGCRLHREGPASLPLGHPNSSVPARGQTVARGQSRAAAGQLRPSQAHSYSSGLEFHRRPFLRRGRTGMVARATSSRPHGAEPELRQPWDELFQPEQKHSSEAMPWSSGTPAGHGGGSSSSHTLTQKPPSPTAAFSLPRTLNCSCVAGGAGLAPQSLTWGSLGGLHLLQAHLSPRLNLQQHLRQLLGAPGAPGDLLVSRTEALGSGVDWRCQGEAAQGGSGAERDHQVLLRMAGPAKAVPRGTLYLPWSQGRGHLPLPGAGKTLYPSNTPQHIWCRNNRHLQLFILRNVQRKMALAHTNPALWLSPRHRRHGRTSSVDREPRPGLDAAVPRMLPTRAPFKAARAPVPGSIPLRDTDTKSPTLRDQQSDPGSAARPLARRCQRARHRARPARAWGICNG